MGYNVYYSTFIPGLSSIIKKLLYKDFDDLEVLHLLENAVLYRTKQEAQKVKNIRYVNNTFNVLQSVETKKALDFHKAIWAFLTTPLYKYNRLTFKKKSFKVFFYDENQFVSVCSSYKEALEKFIKKVYKLPIDNASRDCNEFWIIKRREGFYLFLFRITENKKKLQKGELKQELANLLSLISDPREDDAILEPFAGSGSIALERMRYPFQYMCILDQDKKCINHIKNQFKTRSSALIKNIHVKTGNFLMVDKLGSFNKIITDPPWGVYTKMDNVEAFYLSLLEKCSNLLIHKGVLVLVVSRQITIEKLIEQLGSLEIMIKYDILLSGKKASIYKIQKHLLL